MDRRTALTAAGGLVAASAAGCLGSLAADETGQRTGDPLYPDDRSVPDGASTHHLFVENHDDAAHRAELTVRRPDDDALLLSETYDIPDQRALKVPDLLVDGRTYEFILAVDGGDRHRFDHRVEACPESHEGGSRNAGLRIESSAVDLREDKCDLIVAGSLPSAPHDRFFADENDWF